MSLRPSISSLARLGLWTTLAKPPKAQACRTSIRSMAAQQTRKQSTQTAQETPPENAPRGSSVLSPFFTFLLVAGLGATAYGIYDIYGTLTLWPPEVRKDLRAGLRAKHKGDLDLASWYFARAWELSKTLPDEAFGALPHLKTSGIAIALGEILEMDHKPHKAYDVYVDVLRRMQDIGTKEPLSAPERLRAISISYRLGELAQALGREKEEEEYLTWAVEAILQSASTSLSPEGTQAAGVGEADEKVATATTGEALDSSVDFNTKAMMEELALSEWATRTDLAAPFEALGSFYAQHGKEHYALPLYLHAISILIPPPPMTSSAEERCRGAQLMSNLSELILRRSGQDLTQAESWALKALDIATNTRQQHSYQDPTCEVAYAVALFNVAAIRRMAGDDEKARKLLQMSQKQSEAIGMMEGVEHAKEALRQIAEESNVAQASKKV